MSIFTELDEKKETYTTFPRDPFALAAQLLSQGYDNPGVIREFQYYASTTSKIEHMTISPESVEKATAVKKHFSRKLTMLALKGEGMSSFRETVLELLDQTKTNRINVDFYPVLVKMFDFYLEDMQNAELAKISYSDMEGYYQTSDKINSNRTTELIVLRDVVLRSTRQGSDKHYYFTDANNILYKLTIQSDNPLEHLLENVINDGNVCVKGQSYTTDEPQTGLKYIGFVPGWQITNSASI